MFIIYMLDYCTLQNTSKYRRRIPNLRHPTNDFLVLASRLKVVFGLDAHQYIGGQTKSSLKQQRRVGGERTVGVEQFVKHGIRHPDTFSKLALRDATILKFVFDNLSWVCKPERGEIVGNHFVFNTVNVYHFLQS